MTAQVPSVAPSHEESLRSDSRQSFVKLDQHDVLERASRQLSTLPRPFLRWAGSKRALLPALVDVLPRRFRTYYEPFLGGGSLFFLIQPPRARLSDTCHDLICTYRAVRDRPDLVLRYLRPLVVDRESFYRVRAERPKSLYRRAAQFIYLNKTCWNGLYRVNSAGVFNVPFGAPKTANIIDAPQLCAVSRALRKPGIQCQTGDFQVTLQDVSAGDLVFLDPPYVTQHNNNGFIDYNERLFCWQDQERLAATAREMANRDAHVIVTNAHHREVLDLYDGFYQRASDRASTLAGSVDKRGRVREAIFWYGPPAAL